MINLKNILFNDELGKMKNVVEPEFNPNSEAEADILTEIVVRNFIYNLPHKMKYGKRFCAKQVMKFASTYYENSSIISSKRVVKVCKKYFGEPYITYIYAKRTPSVFRVTEYISEYIYKKPPYNFRLLTRWGDDKWYGLNKVKNKDYMVF